jgi:hypothetical protein
MSKVRKVIHAQGPRMWKAAATMHGCEYAVGGPEGELCNDIEIASEIVRHAIGSSVEAAILLYEAGKVNVEKLTGE